jgi:iron complex outermembrane receptor protein
MNAQTKVKGTIIGNVGQPMPSASSIKGTTSGGPSVFLARAEVEDVNYQYSVLSEFNNNPKLVNLKYVHASGNNVTFYDRGLYNRIGMTSNRFYFKIKIAFYISDEIGMDK